MLCDGSLVGFSSGIHPATGNNGGFSRSACPDLAPARQGDSAGRPDLESDWPEWSSPLQHGFGGLIRQEWESSFSRSPKESRPVWDLSANGTDHQSAFPVRFSGNTLRVVRRFLESRRSLISLNVRLQI
jgi:hypothetical protein